MAFSSRIACVFDYVENGCPEFSKASIACVWIHSISENAAAAASARRCDRLLNMINQAG
jgi:hypothetical protein